MVCLLGRGRMAVMARLLAGGSLSQTIGEEISQQKLAAQCIYRELHEADEANLLDEEDMRVFGLKPMTDPLDLVRCNACKKPVKTSQYAAHAELCRFLNSAEETTLELDGSTGHGKPPRKERKKLLTAYINQATPVAEQERSVSINVDVMAASKSPLDGQTGMSTSFSIDAKRNLACVDGASMMDDGGVSHENTEPSDCAMQPPAKRSKLISSQHFSLSNHPEAASGLTKTRRDQDTFNWNAKQNDCIVSSFPGKNEHCLLTNEIPVPLATKIYYSQRNNHLRSAVAHMYHGASDKRLSSNVISPKVSQESLIQLQASSPIGCSLDQVHDLSKKKEPSAFKPDQSSEVHLAKSGECILDSAGECIPDTNFPHQFPDHNIPRPQTAPVGLLRSKYLSKPYSFDGNSGQSLGTMQQPSGSVPVL